MNDRSHAHHCDWNPARVGQLKALYVDGLSFGLIGVEIGVSRGSVAGKLHRLGLLKRGYTTLKLTRSRPRSPVAELVDADRAARPVSIGGSNPSGGAKLRPKSQLTLDTSHNCSIWNLENASCRFPLWAANVREGLYCGIPEADVAAGKAYCSYHRSKCDRMNTNNAWQSSSHRSLGH